MKVQWRPFIAGITLFDVSRQSTEPIAVKKKWTSKSSSGRQTQYRHILPCYVFTVAFMQHGVGTNTFFRTSPSAASRHMHSA